MPDTGAPHNLPYPSLLDEPDGPAQIQALAEKVAARLDAMVPSGSLLATARSSAPTGYLLCDGATVSRTTYAALFAAIGESYGAGNGSTTFNLPDLRGRVPAGVDGAANRLDSNDALGQSGGAQTVTLTQGQLPAHSHALHGMGPIITSGGGNWQNAPMNLTGPGTGAHVFGGTPIIGGANATSTNSPNGSAHSNMQPYQVVNWIIKT